MWAEQMTTIAHCWGRGSVRRRCIHTMRSVYPHLAQRIVTLRLAPWAPPIKHVTLPLCCFDVGPASLMMGQHWTNTCSMSHLCWGPSPDWVTAWDNAVPANTRHWTNAGLLLAQHLRHWPNISPALVQCLVLAGVLLDDVIIFSHFNKSFHQRPWMGFAVNFAAGSI